MQLKIENACDSSSADHNGVPAKLGIVKLGKVAGKVILNKYEFNCEMSKCYALLAQLFMT